ncbi:hypothetical protein RRG08_035961 [Elysia crispata]|uniref:Uncharacterized protein n=1 Tax=Elysia crispata TaxID=231223 RepID=A0AAE0XS34_9GAST|nr:hypothetical protein RRG08_035961 [Elysia crispata]
MHKFVTAKIKFLRFQSSISDNQDFLVAGEDTTVIQFEVSGNNSVHSFVGINGPQFYYTTTDGVSHKGCMGFDLDTGSCTNRAGVRDACSCEMQTSEKYWLSYTKTATVSTSGGTVYLLWPGNPDLRSDNYTFPEIRGRSFSVAGYIRIFIGVGLVALFAMVSSVGIMCYNKYGNAGARNNHAQGRIPSDVPTQMETEREKEICKIVTPGFPPLTNALLDHVLVYCVFSADSSLEKLFRKSSAYPDKVRIHEKLQ